MLCPLVCIEVVHTYTLLWYHLQDNRDGDDWMGYGCRILNETYRCTYYTLPSMHFRNTLLLYFKSIHMLVVYVNEML